MATTYTDHWGAYRAIFYDDKLCQVGKESGQTNHIERYPPAEGSAAQNLIVLQEAGKPHWGHLVLHSSLQRIITCLALPVNEAVANRYFPTLEEMMEGVAERCRILQADPKTLQRHTLFHWWPTAKASA